MNWQSLTSTETLKILKTDLKSGLSKFSAEKRLHKYGKNKLQQKKNKNLFTKFIEQFSDFMVIILLIASIVSFVTSKLENNNDYIDSIIILAIVIVNAIIGVIQENKAEKAIDALKRLSSPKARVIRDGKEELINSEFLVPGDIILLDTGDLVPADARIIKCYNLKAEESALTGESLPTLKDSNVKLSPNAPIGDRKNMLFSSSSITNGHAVCAVTETGMQTQVGKIANLINTEESPQTPLQIKLSKTGKYLGIGAIVICIVIFILGLIQKVEPLEMFMISISLAVAAIPEGLPAVVTIVLALGVKRLASHRAIVRKLPAVETLGSANVICSDKTGTLTQNKMTVTKLATSKSIIEIGSSAGSEILTLGALCNNSSLILNKDKTYFASGDATEASIVIAAMKSGKPKGAIDNNYPRVFELPFDSNRKLMTTIHKLKSGKYLVITKGAFDVLLKKCSYYENDHNIMDLSSTVKKQISKLSNIMANDALRVLAVAYKNVDHISQNEVTSNSNNYSIENSLVFKGLIGMIDPPRAEAKIAVKQCLNANIKPVMITGDHIITAKAIARQIGIYKEGDLAITSDELNKLSQKELENNIFRYSVFARVSPEHKVKIVKAFQKRGAIVAMTGDGVNDAPALKAADIGCAMGLSGTDVAKNAADMILTDDNFSTIVSAIRQGRGIFENIKKTIHFLLSSNIGEIITVLSAFLLKMPSPLLAIQLLWVNLVTDSLPALALGVEPVDKDIMKYSPNSSKSSLFNKNLVFAIAIEGCFIGTISMLAFTIGRVYFDIDPLNPIIGRTMAFSVLSLSQLIHAFNVRSDYSVFKIGLFSNKKLIISFIICLILQLSVISVPVLSSIFKTSNLNQIQWILVSLLSISPLLIIELEKLLLKRSL